MRITNKIALLMVLVLVFSMLAGCQSDGADDAKYDDGTYFAMEDEYAGSGWKYAVVVTVDGGEITDVNWTGVSKNAGPDKKTASMNGQYPMVENGGAIAPWHEQAEKAVAHLLETQDPEDIEYTDEDGHVDSIAGVTMKVSALFDLTKEALENGPVAAGPYKDGAYHAEEENFSEKSGWKYTLDITVLHGNIVSVNWNAVHKDGGDTKKVMSENGEYGMVENGGAMAPWFEQAAAVEQYLLDEQKAEQPDAIAGASIGLDPFFTLAQEALADAK